MSDIETIKKDIRKRLKNKFINNIVEVKRDVMLLNTFISSFVDDEYTYDEYCQCRIKFETEACDNIVELNINKELELTSQDREIIKNKAFKKYTSNQDATIYEDLLKEEWINWKVEKIMMLDIKILYPIFKYANIEMLKHKIKGEVWEIKKDYFEEMCESKAKALANTIAENNNKIHEQRIRAQNI